VDKVLTFWELGLVLLHIMKTMLSLMMAVYILH
jgi:hypothetical protein